VICSNCGTQQLPGAKFCKRCGTRLVDGCPSCGAPFEPDASFCSECGTRVGGGPEPSETAAGTVRQTLDRAAPGRGVVAGAAGVPVAELRLVSVLFADLVGFTSLAEDRDAEETRELLTRYFELARNVVALYGGTVEKFIGDAVMAVWGTPTAHEDDAERAVRAGLELVDAVRKLGPSIQARAGVMTGEAAVTLGATDQGMVAGDLVNTAARLQSVALPGSVLVGEATMRAASASVAFEPIGEQALKGKTVPIPAWQAMRVVATRGGSRSLGLEAPFVGRDDELRLLKELFHATIREGRARLVSVTGHAGIGKSRLAWEFLKYVDGLVERVLWHDGRSPSYGEGVTFWALGEMVRRRCGLLEGDDERTTRAKVAETLAAYVPDEAERRWIEPALLELLGIESGVGSDLLFGAWRTFFERLATTAPVVLVFEDFHFADPGLLDFVDHLMEWSRAFPLLVITLARPELLEKRPDWGAGKRSFTSLYLEPLAQAEMRELLAGLVPGLPQTAARTIVERADGIPLYAVETVRMLVAEGKLVLEGGVYRPTGDLTTLAVPETLTALIASRLDALEPADRGLIQDAAVLGQSFTLAGLAAVANVPEADLESGLRRLVRRELLTVDTDPRSPERGQYAFVQALIREVAYNTLAKKDRKVRHLAAARFFESLGTELAGALAGHYLAAYRNAPPGPEADALATQARIALRSAGERAAALGSHEQAISLFVEALTVARDPAEEAALHELTALSAAAIDCADDAEEHFRKALELRAGLDDRSAEAATTALYGEVLLDVFRHEPALALLKGASERFEVLADDPALVRLNGQLARAYFLRDDLRGAVAVADTVLEAAERLDLGAVVADTLVTRGSALVDLGRRYEGIGAIEAGQRLATALGLPETIVRAYNNLAALQISGDTRAGLAAAREGMAIARRMGYRDAHLLENAFHAALHTGDWDWATAELEPLCGEDDDQLTRTVAISDIVHLVAARGEPTARLMADLEAMPTNDRDRLQPISLAKARAWLAWVEGRNDLARSEYHRLAEIFPQGAQEWYSLSAHAAIEAGDSAGATEDLDLVYGTGRRGPRLDTDLKTIRAGIAALTDRPEEALALYREAIRNWRGLGLAWDEALCAIEMAALLDPAEPEVQAAIESAREILTRLRARPLLQRLDQAVKRPVATGTVPARRVAGGRVESPRGVSVN
jgi:class 3 adenylate cyclase/tetratricopeptide (TPR) repeat protein